MNNLNQHFSKNEANSLIESVEALGINGNIVPLSWMAHIQFENGKPDFLSMMLLAELIYWHRPEIVARDEKTGKILRWKKRFKGEKLHRSRSSLAKKFFVSERQITDALTRLESGGLIEREVCHQTNRLYLTPIVSQLAKITVRLEKKPAKADDSIQHSTVKENSNVTTNLAACDSLESSDPVQSNEKPCVMDYAPIKGNKEITEENTADSQACEVAAAASRYPEKVIVSNFSQAESFIGDTLTPNQLNHVNHGLKRLNLAPEVLQSLQEEVKAGLLDVTCFTKTARNFHRKLNAMITAIRNGTWTRPFSMDEKHYEANTRQEKQKTAHQHELTLFWNKLWNELGAVYQWIQASPSEDLKAKHKHRYQACLQELAATEQQLLALNSTIDFTTMKQKNKERLHVQ